MNYCDLLFNTTEDALDNLALVDAEQNRRLTYRELRQKVIRLAQYFRTKGYQAGDVILSHLYNSAEAAIVHLAIQHIGGVSCLIDPLFRAHELEYYIKDSGARVVISYLQDTEIRSLFNVSAEIINVKEIEDILYNQPQVEVDGDKESYDFGESELALLLYTSGSTSLPKGVMLPAGCFEVFLRKNNERKYRYESDDRLVCFVPFSHGFGSLSIFIPSLAYKAATVFLRSFHPLKVAQVIAEEKITHIFGVPTHYQQLLRYEALYPQLKRLKAAFCAAAPLNYETALTWLKVTGIYLDEGYGMTETSTLITSRKNCLPEPAGNIGVAPKNILWVEVVDEERNPVPDGIIGEIRVKGLGLMLGYLNKPRETAERLQDGWVYTGDYGYKRSDGSLVICGRKTEFINVAGLKISPVEIEAVLNSCSGIVDSAAVGIENELYGEVIKAFVVLKPDVKITERELIKYCSEKMASFKVPKSITFINEFPRNNLGKIDKQALKAMGNSLSA